MSQVYQKRKAFKCSIRKQQIQQKMSRIRNALLADQANRQITEDINQIFTSFDPPSVIHELSVYMEELNLERLSFDSVFCSDKVHFLEEKLQLQPPSGNNMSVSRLMILVFRSQIQTDFKRKFASENIILSILRNLIFLDHLPWSNQKEIFGNQIFDMAYQLCLLANPEFISIREQNLAMAVDRALQTLNEFSLKILLVCIVLDKAKLRMSIKNKLLLVANKICRMNGNVFEQLFYRRQLLIEIGVACSYSFEHATILQSILSSCKKEDSRTLTLLTQLTYHQSWIQYDYIEEFMKEQQNSISIEDTQRMRQFLITLEYVMDNSNLNPVIIQRIYHDFFKGHCYHFYRKQILKDFSFLMKAFVKCRIQIGLEQIAKSAWTCLVKLDKQLDAGIRNNIFYFLQIHDKQFSTNSWTLDQLFSQTEIQNFKKTHFSQKDKEEEENYL